jgi:hypothetical protein
LTVFKSDHEYTQWWERTSVRQWASFFKFSRENNIPVTIHTLRMIRATLLYDTVAVRICKEVDRFDVYMKFRRYREKRAKQRIFKRMGNQFDQGLNNTLFLRMEEIAKTSEKLMYRTQGFLSSPVFNFGSMVGKWFFVLALILHFLGQALTFTLLALLIAAGINLAGGQLVAVPMLLSQVVSNTGFQVVLIGLGVTHFRQMLFRLSDQEI